MNTTTATNGSHSLTSKAYDAALNVGTSVAVGVTVSNGVPVNIGGWTLIQANATLNYTIPAGTTIPSKGYVIVARNSTKAAFQTFWGVTLGANVVYLTPIFPARSKAICSSTLRRSSGQCSNSKTSRSGMNSNRSTASAFSIVSRTAR